MTHVPGEALAKARGDARPSERTKSLSAAHAQKGRPRRVAIVGASGSVGKQALEVCAQYPDRLRVVLLSAHTDLDFLREAAKSARPEAVCLTSGRSGDLGLPAGVRGFAGEDALERAFEGVEFDLLVNAIVGSAGLRPSFLALQRGRTVATANKESLVIGGSLLRRTAAGHGANLLPIDSEHSAIWQCLRAGSMAEVESLWLTASGGPFLRRDPATFDRITLEDALAHPTWSMGRKITVDSATMMNKGFEVIEARWLFDLPAERIRVVIHPQSVVHSAVAFRDGSVMAQMGVPDMKLPIAYALLHPERHPVSSRLELDTLGRLDFESPDPSRFPALALARAALAEGDTACVALNAANEEAVSAFLDGRVGFPQITQCVAAQLDKVGAEPLPELHDIYEVDSRVRKSAQEWIGRHGAVPAPLGRRN